MKKFRNIFMHVLFLALVFLLVGCEANSSSIATDSNSNITNENYRWIFEGFESESDIASIPNITEMHSKLLPDEIDVFKKAWNVSGTYIDFIFFGTHDFIELAPKLSEDPYDLLVIVHRGDRNFYILTDKGKQYISFLENNDYLA